MPFAATALAPLLAAQLLAPSPQPFPTNGAGDPLPRQPPVS